MTRPGDREHGQATIELVAMVPVVLAMGVIAWQLALAGHAAWMSAHAARVAARASLVGRDPTVAARSAVPASMRRGLTVTRPREGGVRVTVPVPGLLPGRGSPAHVAATSSLGRQR
jgi:pilus assembly protein CpaE